MTHCRKCGTQSPLMYLVSGAWLCFRCRRTHLKATGKGKAS